ncbi:hypothetical protein ZWY2020_051104 [Hordeum vulgare]|nr:hypothetical protein ZWY2020_051104 [Hordeum vulgare]
MLGHVHTRPCCTLAGGASAVLMKQVVQSQQEMQQRFLATMEKREAKRAARYEAWCRQETTRVKSEPEHWAHERAAADPSDAYIIAFLQHVGGQATQIEVPASNSISSFRPLFIF